MTSNVLHLMVLMGHLDHPSRGVFLSLLAFFGGGEGSSSLDVDEGDDRASCCTFFFGYFFFDCFGA